MPATLSIDLDPDLGSELERIASQRHQTSEGLAREVLLAFLEESRRTTAEIEQAVREADAGDFATDEEVAAVYARWS